MFSDSPSLLLYGYQEGWSGRGVRVTTNYHLVPRFWAGLYFPLYSTVSAGTSAGSYIVGWTIDAARVR